MKRTLIALAALVLTGTGLAAQNKLELKPYGFFRTYGLFDSRATKSLTEDLFFFLPLDENNIGGEDLNAVPSWNYQAITTRLGLDAAGYELCGVKFSGKIEADFYSLNGTVGVLRMRQAFMGLDFQNGHSLKIGQTWHPMAADMAHCINLETAAPFSPFNRSAQLQWNWKMNDHFTLTGAAISHLQYISNGPNGKTNKYQRHALPELYAGLSYANGGLLARAGVSVLSLRPNYGYVTDAVTGISKKYDEWFTTFSPFAYIQWTNGDFQLKAKTVFAQAADYMQMNSGYAVCSIKDDGFSAEYTPFRASVSFVSAQYKLSDHWTLMGMVGYHQNLGTAEDIIGPVYFSNNGYANIDSIVRLTPTVIYNIGKFQLGLEYDLTSVAYGALQADGTVDNTHNVMNHRLLCMAKLSF